MRYLLIPLLLLTGCTVTTKEDPTVVTVDKKQLYELTYEWAMYKECAIIAYAKLHDCSREEATQHLETCVNYAREKEFLGDWEYNHKWGKNK